MVIREAKDTITGKSIDPEQFRLATFWLNGGRYLLTIGCADGFKVRTLKAMIGGRLQTVGEEPGLGYRYGVDGDQSTFELVCDSTSLSAQMPQIDPAVMRTINRWSSTMRAGDLAGHMTVYADSVDQFYTKRSLSKRAVESEVANILRTYQNFPVFELSNWSVNQLTPRGTPKTDHRGSLQNRPTMTIIQDVDSDPRVATLGRCEQCLERREETASYRIGTARLVNSEDRGSHWSPSSNGR
jgi:hypothetical protein